MRPSPVILLGLALLVLGLRWALRRAGWPRGRALAGGVAGAYTLSLLVVFAADPADLPRGGRALAAALWGVGHLVLFLALWPLLGRAPRS